MLFCVTAGKTARQRVPCAGLIWQLEPGLSSADLVARIEHSLGVCLMPDECLRWSLMHTF